MGERMQNNGQVAAGPQQQTHSPAAHAHSAYHHMSTPDAAIRPLADEQGRSNKVESLLQSQLPQTNTDRKPDSAAMSASNGNRSSESSSSSAGLPLKDHLPLTGSPPPIYSSSEPQRQQQSHHTPQMNAQGTPDPHSQQQQQNKQQQASATTQYSRTNRPMSQTGAQLPSIPAMSFASSGRQPIPGPDPSEAGGVSGPQTQRIPPPTGSFGPSQYSSGQPPLRRTRPHAATISEPMMGPQSAAMQQSRPSQAPSSQAPPPPPPQQQQQPFRFFPRQAQGPAGFEGRSSQHPSSHFQQQQQQQQQKQHSSQDMRPRRLSFANSHMLQEGHRDQYETSFSRSTNTAGAAAHYSPGGQPSPTAPYFSSHQSMHPQMNPQQQQQQRQHPSLPPPPASAPSHQQHFGQPPNQPHRPQAHAGNVPGAYGPPRSVHGPPNSTGIPQQRSLSPPLAMRRQFPPAGRFEPGNGPQRQQLPVPFPRIPSPMRHTATSTQSASNMPQQQTPGAARNNAPSATATATATVSVSAAASGSGSGSAATAAAAIGPNSSANANSQSPARESTRRLSSVVWGPTGFERLDTGMSRCKICGKEYSRGSSTGTLKRHFKQHHVNMSLTSPYTRNSPPGSSTQVSRPRAYSHRIDMRSRRETSPSPFATTSSVHHSQNQQQPYQQPQVPSMQQLVMHQHQHQQSQLRSQIHQRQHQQQSQQQNQQLQQRQQQMYRLGSPRDDKQGSNQSMITPGTSGSSTAVTTLFSRNSGSVPADIDSSSVIAGSALLSMAAGGDSRMTVDNEPIRRAGRLSDPSVYQSHVNSMSSIAAMDDDECDIHISRTPSTSTSVHSIHVLRSDHNGSSSGGLLRSGISPGNGRRAGSVEHLMQPHHSRVTLPPLLRH
ncbi:hypothetical protein FB639_003531, partial [Coemansia asiatica]